MNEPMQDVVAACWGKVAFCSKQSALKALDRQQRRRAHFRKTSSGRMHAYRCMHCRKFHLGG